MTRIHSIQCPGCHHTLSIKDGERPRCRNCTDVAYTEEVDGLLLMRNMFGKLVDRKPVKREPGRAHADSPYQEFVYYPPTMFGN